MTARHALGLFTLPEIIEQPTRIMQVPPDHLQQLYAQSAAAVCLPDLQDSTREYLQYIRRELAQTLDIRRRAEQQQAVQAATIAQDATDDQDASAPAQSRDERIGEILRSLIHLAAQPPDDRSDQGGKTVRRPQPPTRPTPPAMARPVADINF